MHLSLHPLNEHSLRVICIFHNKKLNKSAGTRAPTVTEGDTVSAFAEPAATGEADMGPVATLRQVEQASECVRSSSSCHAGRPAVKSGDAGGEQQFQFCRPEDARARPQPAVSLE